MVSAIAGIVGAVIGWLGTSTLASLLLPSTTISSSMGRGVQQVASLSIQPDPLWMLVAFLIVVCLGALGSLYPAWRASRTKPVEALKND
ncbi:MAG: outer membrane-specific lipoprotein transporter subunit LolC [Methanomassiliicoccales archaeon PtaU1.Bin030]|nr:MAG: outer membrane-specific lipoprotein transporter subunit LolC [Methanomassiliicoccales archaeon PtaU1.Bin030]